jgi:decaprenyl-phosphate phosphoribosyltransferase
VISPEVTRSEHGVPRPRAVPNPNRSTSRAPEPMDPVAPAPHVTRASGLRALVRAARPKQWTKNALVLMPLLPAGSQLRHAHPFGVVLALVAFCLISSSVYLINDSRDVEADRAHPVKRNRPIAAGLVSVRIALATAAVLAVMALGIAALGGWQLAIVVATYYAIQLGYCFGLKHEPVIELACVASGFLLRALAGGVATGIPLSQWFLLTTAFGSLFMATGKRYGEARMGERTGNKVRRVVERYTATYLRFVWTLAATVVLVTYALWTFDMGARTGSVGAEISLVPFTLAIMRFAITVDAGTAEEPEEIVLHDRVLLVLGAAWALTLAVAVYV